MLDQQPKQLQNVVMGQMPGLPKQNYQGGNASGGGAQQKPNLEYMDTSAYANSTPQGISGPSTAGGNWDFSGPIGSGQIGGPTSFDDEPPLLEELGIDFNKICERTISVLNPLKKTVPDSDMAGPLLIALLLGAAMLLRGKVNFGYIYGVGGVGCVSLWLVMTLMCDRGIDFWQTASILGYCLLPMVILAFLSLFFSATGPVMVAFTALVVGWCAWRSSEMLVILMQVNNEKALVAYPVGLFYMCFALLSIF